MGSKPLPTIREAFLDVYREESCLKVMLSPHTLAPIIEGSVLASCGPTSDIHRHSSRPWCDHYHRPGHTKETC